MFSQQTPSGAEQQPPSACAAKAAPHLLSGPAARRRCHGPQESLPVSEAWGTTAQTRLVAPLALPAAAAVTQAAAVCRPPPACCCPPPATRRAAWTFRLVNPQPCAHHSLLCRYTLLLMIFCTVAQALSAPTVSGASVPGLHMMFKIDLQLAGAPGALAAMSRTPSHLPIPAPLGPRPPTQAWALLPSWRSGASASESA